jgi:hypothetical protein
VGDGRDKLKEGTKHDDGKIRWDLIPLYPLYELAYVYTIGADKYEDENWRKGLKFKKLQRALMNHITKWFSGYERDEEDGQHHLASVAWIAFSLMEFERVMRDNPEFKEAFDNRSDIGALENFNWGDIRAKLRKDKKESDNG